MKSQSNNYPLAPFVTLTLIYFIVGFLTTVNGQLQAPLQIAFLSQVEALRNTLIALIPFTFFLGYLLNSSLGGKWIDRHGYKGALMRALICMILALIAYLLSSYVTSYWSENGLTIGSDYIPLGYLVFLLGSFLMGSAAAILQVVINPYINAYQLPGTQPIQRMSINGAINSFGTTIAPFFVTGVLFAGVSMGNVSANQLILPFALMALAIVVVTIITQRLHLPDIEGTTRAEEQGERRSIWSFRHLRLGVIAIFFYVGAEVMIGVNVNLHAVELIGSGRALRFLGSDNLIVGGLELGIPALLATLYWGGLMIGRMMSSFMRKISARTQLIFTTTLATLLTCVAIFSENLWILIAVGLCHSIMWGAIFTLSVKGLKSYTSKASAVFMMGVFGGAVFPLLQSFLADMLGSWQWTWSIVVVCELVMLHYAVVGSRIKNDENV